MRVIRHEPVVTVLEDRPPVNYTVVGRRPWLEGCFPGNALSGGGLIRVEDPSHLREVHDDLGRWPVHGVDSETHGGPGKKGLDAWRKDSKIVLFQIGTEEKVYLLEPDLIPEFRAELESDAHLHLLQNGIYDFKFILAKYRIHLVRMFCTMLTEQLLTAGLSGKKVGLEDIGRRYPPYQLMSKAARELFINFQGTFNLEMLYYAGHDVWSLFPIYRAQLEQIKAKQQRTVCGIEFDAMPCTAEMELGGVWWHTGKHELALTYFRRRQNEIEEFLQAECRKLASHKDPNLKLFPGFETLANLQSNDLKMELLESWGFDVENIQQSTLEEINDSRVKILAEYANVMKIVSTYGDNIQEKIDPETGLWHPQYNQMGAGDSEDRMGHSSKATIATGRMCGNAQQFPRPLKIFDPIVNVDEISRLENKYADRLQTLRALQKLPEAA